MKPVSATAYLVVGITILGASTARHPGDPGTSLPPEADRAFFLNSACEECVPAEGLPRGRYWIVTRPILTGPPEDFSRVVRLFRQELSSRFHPAETTLSRTVVLRHRPDVYAARRTRRMFIERRSGQGYRILEVDFRPEPSGPRTGGHP